MSSMHTWVISEKVPKISGQSDRGIQRYLIRRQRYIIVFSSFRFTQVICSCTPLALSVCVFSLCVYSLCVYSLCMVTSLLLTNTVGHQHPGGHFPPQGLIHPRGRCSRVFSFILLFSVMSNCDYCMTLSTNTLFVVSLLSATLSTRLGSVATLLCFCLCCFLLA